MLNFDYHSVNTIAMGATGVEPMRLWILPIHFLRLLGYESTDETICAALPVGAIFVGTPDNNVGATIGRPLVMVLSE